MSEPLIKKEESPEASAVWRSLQPPSIVTARTVTSATSAQGHLMYHESSTVEPGSINRQTTGKLSTHCHGLPHDYDTTLPQLPSQFTSAVATGHENKQIVTTSTRQSNSPVLDCHQPHVRHRSPYSKKLYFDMNEQDSGDRNVVGDELQTACTPLHATDLHREHDHPVAMPRNDLEHFHDHLQLLQNAAAASEQQGGQSPSKNIYANLTTTVSEQRMVISELITFNHNVHAMVQQLDNRIAKIEYENNYLQSMLTPRSEFMSTTSQSAPAKRSSLYRTDGDEGSPSPLARKAESRGRNKRTIDDTVLNGTSSGQVKKTKARKPLQIKIPGKAMTQSNGGLPTPLTKTATTLSNGSFTLLSNVPKTPITPGRIGPSHFNKRSTTSINKRKIHNLDTMIPPTYVQIPLLPLTDTELIVYFFNSLSRPIVSLRLYARNWGPAMIVETLNDHRDIDPPYLRNTCSVKCTTAIKNGKKKFGDAWWNLNRDVLAEADDIKATDLIHLGDDELNYGVDYDMRSLGIGLKKHPKQDVDGGIFTRCVKYCQDNNAAYTVSNVLQLAMDLQEGRTPQHPPSPTLSSVRANAKRPRSKSLKQDKDSEDEEDSETPSPTDDCKTITTMRSRTTSDVSTNPRTATPDSVTGSVDNDDTAPSSA